jgi:hypothetical protein
MTRRCADKEGGQRLAEASINLGSAKSNEYNEWNLPDTYGTCCLVPKQLLQEVCLIVDWWAALLN